MVRSPGRTCNGVCSTSRGICAERPRARFAPGASCPIAPPRRCGAMRAPHRHDVRDHHSRRTAARMEALIMSSNRQLSLAVLSLATLAACGPSKEHQHADSVAASVMHQQTKLAAQLTAQKDSLVHVVLSADDFIMKIDSSVS